MSITSLLRRARITIAGSVLVATFIFSATPTSAAGIVSIATVTQSVHARQITQVNLAFHVSDSQHVINVTPSQVVSQNGIALATVVSVDPQCCNGSAPLAVAKVTQSAAMRQYVYLNVEVFGDHNTFQVTINPVQIVDQSANAAAALQTPSNRGTLRTAVWMRSYMSQRIRVNVRFHGNDNAVAVAIHPAQGLHQTIVTATTDGHGNPLPGSQVIYRRFWIERHYYVWHWGGWRNAVTTSYQLLSA